MRYDLGGLGLCGSRITVNLHDDADIHADFLDLDAFCEDGAVEEFYLSHALEHIPNQRYRQFLADVLRKLRPGGVLRVVQTDIKRSLDLYYRGELSFLAVRTVIFPPADRLRRNPYNQHFNMWGAEELAADFLAAGFAGADIFDAGSWRLDTTDELHPGEVEKFHHIQIPNLGVEARRAVAADETGLPLVNDRRPAEQRIHPSVAEGSIPQIPRIIHQTWKTTEIPPVFRQEWRESWQELNPAWEYRFWTDAGIDEFVRTHYPDFYPIFLDYDVPIKRVDAFRYLLMKSVGGVYADLDSVCLKPLDALLDGQHLLVGCQHPGSWLESNDHVCNAFIASIPNHAFWDGITLDLAAHAHLHLLKATGPDFLTSRLHRAMAFLDATAFPAVVDHSLLFPFPWNDSGLEEARKLSRSQLAQMFPEAFTVSFWTASWI